MTSLENLNNYFEIFEHIVFEGKGFSATGREFGLNTPAVHARYEFIRQAVYRDLLMIAPTVENEPFVTKLFTQAHQGLDILTLMRKLKDDIYPYYRTIRARMRFNQWRLDEEKARNDALMDAEALHVTCKILAQEPTIIPMLQSLLQ